METAATTRAQTRWTTSCARAAATRRSGSPSTTARGDRRRQHERHRGYRRVVAVLVAVCIAATTVIILRLRGGAKLQFKEFNDVDDKSMESLTTRLPGANALDDFVYMCGDNTSVGEPVDSTGATDDDDSANDTAVIVAVVAVLVAVCIAATTVIILRLRGVSKAQFKEFNDVDEKSMESLTVSPCTV
ncbi:hypothetical protein DIPPA_33201 [Diplonema papillatum]|nr:hypothetical protein DIPPA_33201 [Diplonema papillatum]